MPCYSMLNRTNFLSLYKIKSSMTKAVHLGEDRLGEPPMMISYDLAVACLKQQHMECVTLSRGGNSAASQRGRVAPLLDFDLT